MLKVLRNQRTVFERHWLYYYVKGFFFPWRKSPQLARTSSLPKLHDHIQTHHNLHVSPAHVISPSQRPLPDTHNTQKRTSMPTADSIPPFQQVSGRRPTPQTARTLGPALLNVCLLQFHDQVLTLQRFFILNLCVSIS